MKKLLLPIALLLGISLSKAQNSSTAPASMDSLLQSEIRVNLAVPSNPAYMALNEQGGNLLRPSNPKEFSVAVSQFFQQGQLILPQNFGLEFSPSMVLRNGNLLKDSAKGECWDPLRISLATAAAPQASSSSTVEQLAIGLHYTYEKSGTSFEGYKQTLRHALQPLTDDYEARVDSLRKVYYRDNGITPRVIASLTEDSLAKVITARNVWADSIYTTMGEKTISKGSFDEMVKRVKTKYKRDSWNDFRLDVASAFVIWSPDTLARIGLDSSMIADTLARFQSLSFWGGASFPLFGTNYLQGLVGGNYEIGRTALDSAYKSVLTLNGRLYVGTNRLKGFVEGQYKQDQIIDFNSFLTSLGVEFNLYDGIWVHFFVGLESNLDTQKSRMVSNFNFNLTLPEKFRLN